MKRDTFPESDGMAVWLREDEIKQLLDELWGTRRRIAGLLAARCGLRREVVVDVTPADVVVGRDGAAVCVPEGKGDEYREVPPRSN